MSNPLMRSDVEDHTVANPTGEAETPKAGPESPDRPEAHQTAGATDGSPQLSAMSGPEWAMRLLLSALSEMEQEGRVTTAAGVSARMRQIDPSFTTAAAGFPSFRALLERTVAAGQISLSTPPGASDVLLASATPAAQPKTSPSVPADQRKRARGGWLHRDLWRALTDWSGAGYVYHRDTRRTVPDASGEARVSGALRVPVPTSDEWLAWMRDFAEHLEPKSAAASLLSSLELEDPESSFRAAIGLQPQIRRRWEGYLRVALMDRMQAWSKEQGIAFEELLDARPQTGSDQPSLKQRASYVAQSWADGQSTATVRTSTSEEDMRRQVFEVLAKLPLAELLKLPIPLEYTIRR